MALWQICWPAEAKGTMKHTNDTNKNMDFLFVSFV
jgi:hypothetical protein